MNPSFQFDSTNILLNADMSQLICQILYPNQALWKYHNKITKQIQIYLIK